MRDLFRASPVFALAVLLTLTLAGLYSLMVGIMAVGLNSLLPGPFAQMSHFTEAHHRTHDLTFGYLFVPTVVGMLAQFRRPFQNVAGQLMALVPALGLALTLVLAVVLTGNNRVFQPPWVTVGLATLVATALHPTWLGLFHSFSLSRISAQLLALVAVAAVPLLMLASASISLQGSVADDHAAAGHYGFMAAFAITTIGIALLAGLRPVGWRLAAAVAGLLPVALGLTSLMYPASASSLDAVWTVAAIAWGATFILAAELIHRAGSKATDGGRKHG